ncbi:MAG: 3'(2'),5'-bisphosphate nucleotidase CysQ [Planctomycetota bacterium]
MNSDPTPAEIERDLAFAIDAARVAGQRALTLRASKRWHGDVLADVGDQAADGFLQGYVRGRYPDDGILSEETADSTARLARERTWIIDPLDGTREFSELRDDWAVHVALTRNGKPYLGAVALPVLEAVMWGVCGAPERMFGSEGAATLLTGETESADPPRVAVSRSHTPSWMPAFTREFSGVTVPCGSVGMKVALLLTGQADIYVHKKGLKEWDTCAPEAVACALGWTVCKLRGEQHRYNQADPKNHELVVCRPAWKDRVLAAIEACGALKA